MHDSPHAEDFTTPEMDNKRISRRIRNRRLVGVGEMAVGTGLLFTPFGLLNAAGAGFILDGLWTVITGKGLLVSGLRMPKG